MWRPFTIRMLSPSLQHCYEVLDTLKTRPTQTISLIYSHQPHHHNQTISRAISESQTPTREHSLTLLQFSSLCWLQSFILFLNEFIQLSYFKSRYVYNSITYECHAGFWFPSWFILMFAKLSQNMDKFINHSNWNISLYSFENLIALCVQLTAGSATVLNDSSKYWVIFITWKTRASHIHGF